MPARSAVSSVPATCWKAACRVIGRRMRVTTQLIDTDKRRRRVVDALRPAPRRHLRGPGRDRTAGDACARAEPRCDERDRLTGQGTEDLDAYLAFLQGRSLPANDRVVDTRDAIEHFERAMQARPAFADAYVSLAAAKLFVADYEIAEDRSRALRDRAPRGPGARRAGAGPRSGQWRCLPAARAHRLFDDLVRGRSRLPAWSRAEPECGRGLCGPRHRVVSEPRRGATRRSSCSIAPARSTRSNPATMSPRPCSCSTSAATRVGAVRNS